jgi:hypothetical protein
MDTIFIFFPVTITLKAISTNTPIE